MSDFGSNQFTDARHFEGRVLDNFRNFSDRDFFASSSDGSVNRLFHHAGAGDAHIDDRLRLARAVECAAIKGTSSGILQKITSLQQPNPSLSAVMLATSKTR